MSYKTTPTTSKPVAKDVNEKVHKDAPENSSESTAKHSILDSSFPVLLPYDEALHLSQDDFEILVQKLVANREVSRLKRPAEEPPADEPVKKAAFVQGLEKHRAHVRERQDLARENVDVTLNCDVTHVSSGNPLVDLFYDLGRFTPRERLEELLEKAWMGDAGMTLKIIFNMRSIHVGKSNKMATYMALGWLAEKHPHTLLKNLVWLVRPMIEKKVSCRDKDGKAVGGEANDEDGEGAVAKGNLTDGGDIDAEDFDMIDADEAMPEKVSKTTDVRAETAYDVINGLSHGYYKDLLNILVFAANDQLKLNGDFEALLTQKQDRSKGWRRKVEWDTARAKELRKTWRKQQNERVTEKLQNDPFYRALHMTVARIFARQLKNDKELLESNDHSHISLAAKWAPTFGEFHDKHTFILSSIAEALYPEPSEVSSDAGDREGYLRRAREAFRKHYSSPLRKALAVVERNIAANTFTDIQYERVPSHAMSRYSQLFYKKDQEHFTEYFRNAASGKVKISGATLSPATLVRKVKKNPYGAYHNDYAEMMGEAKEEALYGIVNAQWKTLVQRVKDSGSLGSSIAICDVSSSMEHPSFSDGTTPMDSAIGLSLLVSEVTAPPFGGGFITFSAEPAYVSFDASDDATFVQNVRRAESANWAMNTNFVKVFEDVILPMAVSNNLKQEDMVRQVFVFSDMQFDAAEDGAERWTTSYQRIKKRYREAGYEMPKLIFWNLAANSTSKPVTMKDQNTALVSGYSQGMLKVFLDGGNFVDEMELVETEGEDGMVEVTTQPKTDQLSMVKKVVSHKSYGMLRVVD